MRAAARLKLREEEPGEAHLIQYARPDAADASDERATGVVPVADRPMRCARRSTTPRRRVVVEKRRRLLLWEGVRIHLDEVEGLGSFVELEAVAAGPDSDLSAERDRSRGFARSSASATTLCATGRTPTCSERSG